jgi:hypothetical protein
VARDAAQDDVAAGAGPHNLYRTTRPDCQGETTMKRAALALTLVALLVGPALAQTPAASTPTRLRGTVEKLDDHKLAVKTREGSVVTVALEPNYSVAALVKKSISDIKPGDYVASTGIKGSDGKLHAIEVRIFPESMRGSNEGQFAWDLQPDTMMTNATVSGIASAAGGQTLKVKYKGSESEYIVGPDTPVLTYAPGDPSLLKPGGAVFLVANKHPDGTLTASRITAEKAGVKPPM